MPERDTGEFDGKHYRTLSRGDSRARAACRFGLAAYPNGFRLHGTEAV